jgi:hypothetical protein
VPLHLMAGSKEDAETVTAFFQDTRGGRGDPLRVVSDGAPGGIKAIKIAFHPNTDQPLAPSRGWNRSVRLSAVRNAPACRAIGQPRSTPRREAAEDEARLTATASISPARCYGYRRITALLRQAGWLCGGRQAGRADRAARGRRRRPRAAPL